VNHSALESRASPSATKITPKLPCAISLNDPTAESEPRVNSIPNVLSSGAQFIMSDHFNSLLVPEESIRSSQGKLLPVARSAAARDSVPPATGGRGTAKCTQGRNARGDETHAIILRIDLARHSHYAQQGEQQTRENAQGEGAQENR